MLLLIGLSAAPATLTSNFYKLLHFDWLTVAKPWSLSKMVHLVTSGETVHICGVSIGRAIAITNSAQAGDSSKQSTDNTSKQQRKQCYTHLAACHILPTHLEPSTQRSTACLITAAAHNTPSRSVPAERRALTLPPFLAAHACLCS